MLEDSNELHKLTEPGISQIKWDEFFDSRIFNFKGDPQAPSRFLSDHLKSGETNRNYTAWFFAYFILMNRGRKLNGSTLTDKFQGASPGHQKLLQGEGPTIFE